MWDQNGSTSDPTPRQLDYDDDDDIKMDLKQTRDGKAWTGFIWLTIGTVVPYNPHDILQHPTKTECSATWLSEPQSCVHSVCHAIQLRHRPWAASHSLLLFYPQLLWTMSTTPKCMPLVKAAATSICGNGMGKIRKCTGMWSVNSAIKCGVGLSKELQLTSPQN